MIMIDANHFILRFDCFTSFSNEMFG